MKATKWFTEEQVKTLGFREELEAPPAAGIKELKRRGVRILGGGDYGFSLTPHGENARDLDHLIRYCGFTPMEALQSMTKHGGAAMDLPDDLGQVREGFLADLLLVAGDPLTNPKVLLDRDKLLAVMKNGSSTSGPAAGRSCRPETSPVRIWFRAAPAAVDCRHLAHSMFAEGEVHFPECRGLGWLDPARSSLGSIAALFQG